jgi:hypothetical protein
MILLDTHALVWWLLSPEELTERARLIIGDRDNKLWISVASVYEIEYKRDRDVSLQRFPKNIPGTIPTFGFEWLEIDAADLFCAARFDKRHSDPWDRIIAAQAQQRDLLLMTSDRNLTRACQAWQVPTLWCRA